MLPLDSNKGVKTGRMQQSDEQSIDVAPGAHSGLDRVSSDLVSTWHCEPSSPFARSGSEGESQQQLERSAVVESVADAAEGC